MEEGVYFHEYDSWYERSLNLVSLPRFICHCLHVPRISAWPKRLLIAGVSNRLLSISFFGSKLLRRLSTSIKSFFSSSLIAILRPCNETKNKMSDSEGSERGVPLREPLSPSTTPEPAARQPTAASSSSTKRKRAESEEPELEDSDGELPNQSGAGGTTSGLSKRAAKKAKQKAKGKSKKETARDEALDSDLGVNHALAHMDGQLLADHIAQRVRRFEGDKLSPVEEDELRLSASFIKDTTSWSLARTTDKLPLFMEEYSKPRRGTGLHAKRKLSHASPHPGCPHTLVIAGSGIRAADVTRALRSFQTKECQVAKLFAKHIKLKEAIEGCQKSRMGIGVGTPQRLNDLIEAGALKVSKLERVVVDASYIDGKKRGVLDMKDTVGPLIRLLARKEFREGFASENREEKVDLIFF